jgi:NAD-dependent deacetylase
MQNDESGALQRLIDESRRVCFFGGAGVSTESGIPDFRSTNGLYNQQWDFPPETILSHSFFMQNTAEFYRFYRAKIICEGIKPNTAHIVLANMEASGKLSAVITQNIDGLHQLAGSKNVLELHGSIHRNHCMDCGAFYTLDAIKDCEGIPHCQKAGCNGILKPDVVLYGEGLDNEVISTSVQEIESADLLIIGGTSLTVYPAAGLVQSFSGKVVVINKSDTSENRRAALVIRDSIGKALGALRV